MLYMYIYMQVKSIILVTKVKAFLKQIYEIARESIVYSFKLTIMILLNPFLLI